MHKSRKIVTRLLPLCVTILLFCSSVVFANIKTQARELIGQIVSVRLHNGNVLSGKLITLEFDEEYGEGVLIDSPVGDAFIALEQMAGIEVKGAAYRHDHRLIFMPTANAINNNHFIGVLDLVGLQGGAGIFDFASVTFARTFIPTLAARDQFSLVNVKWTLFDAEIDRSESLRRSTYALGLNTVWLNNNNRLMHIYGVGTLDFTPVELTFAGYINIGGSKNFTIGLGEFLEPLQLNTDDSNLVFGHGANLRISTHSDLRILYESWLWTDNFQRATNAIFALGLQISKSNYTTDFAVAVSLDGVLVPHMSFTWTPF